MSISKNDKFEFRWSSTAGRLSDRLKNLDLPPDAPLTIELIRYLFSEEEDYEETSNGSRSKSESVQKKHGCSQNEQS